VSPHYNTTSVYTHVGTTTTSKVTINSEATAYSTPVSPAPTTYAPAPLPSPSGYPVPPKNITTPVSPALPEFTGAASTFGGSVVLAGAVALGAVLFA
jgi:hypothetical protein